MNSCLNIRPQNIIVVGDIMLDIIIDGSINKIANEAPIPVLHQNTEIKKLGGCGNVLMNLQSLGCNKLFLVSMIGDDMYGKDIQEIISKKPEIVSKLYTDKSYCTTVKTRGFSNKKIVFRYDIEKNNNPIKLHIEKCKEYIENIINNNEIDSIILSDYNKGFLIHELTSYVIFIANKNNIPTFVDPKVDYKKYIGCTLFKPNIKEIYDIFNIEYSYDKLKEIHEFIQLKVNCTNTLITLSEKGISLLSNNNFYLEKAHPTEVCDVTGAGDIVISVFAYYYKYVDTNILIKLSTWIGTHSVKFPGTYIINNSDILKGYKFIRKTKLVSIEEVSKINSPIVITNGCFDIIHEGHLLLFKYCKSLAHIDGLFIVALNSDESVQKLKGSSRPINDLHSRIALLNEIDSIDMIITFNETSPYEIYSRINPTVLVKGGDYTPDTIVGKDFCKEIKIFNYIDGKSTTNIIKKIKNNLDIL